MFETGEPPVPSHEEGFEAFSTGSTDPEVAASTRQLSSAPPPEAFVDTDVIFLFAVDGEALDVET